MASESQEFVLQCHTLAILDPANYIIASQTETHLVKYVIIYCFTAENRTLQWHPGGLRKKSLSYHLHKKSYHLEKKSYHLDLCLLSKSLP